MAFIVEDGTGVDDANSYATTAEADAYFLDRGETAWTGTEPIKQQALIKATDYIEVRWGPSFKGRPEHDLQPLSFPRLGLFDDRGQVVGIPARLKRAVYEYALRALTAPLMPDPETHASGKTVQSSREKLGPLEEETSYVLGAAIDVTRPYPAADRLLKAYVAAGGRSYR